MHRMESMIEASNILLTPCAFVYSASRYTNSCFVFQLKSGVKSGARITYKKKMANPP